MYRRDLLKTGAVASVFSLSNFSRAISEKKNDPPKKVVWILLRGAMDALHALPPLGDKHLMRHRASLAEPIAKDAFSLERGFALHNGFEHCFELYQKKQFLPVVATASPYRARSHFDAQDLLESGGTRVKHNSGWLARAAVAVGGEGLSIARSLPISMRGENALVRSWFPSNFKPAKEDLYSRLEKLYQNDAAFRGALEQGLETQSMLNVENEKQKFQFNILAKNCGELLAENPQSVCAMLELGGWDTHNAQLGRLQRQFERLDKGIAALQYGLGKQWQNTLVIIATEFGRTIKVNGTHGTDHGTASATFFAGGAVQGGKVLGDWPGLANERLFEQRDLMPTSDTREWIANALKKHWGLSDKQLAIVFPGLIVV